MRCWIGNRLRTESVEHDAECSVCTAHMAKLGYEQTAALAALQADRDHWRDANRLTLQAGDTLRSQVTRLREALQGIEWSQPEHRCPWCYEKDTDGHAAACGIGRALREG
jgi:hypothetical protein